MQMIGLRHGFHLRFYKLYMQKESWPGKRPGNKWPHPTSLQVQGYTGLTSSSNCYLLMSSIGHFGTGGQVDKKLFIASFQQNKE